MATIRSYTSLEQSKKLAEILPIKSADMEYILEQWIDEKTHHHKEGYCEIPVVKVDDDCPLHPITHPCWSLAALLGVLPSATLDSSNDHYYRLHCVERYTEWYDNPVDACYEIIIKLHDNKFL